MQFETTWPFENIDLFVMKCFLCFAYREYKKTWYKLIFFQYKISKRCHRAILSGFYSQGGYLGQQSF
jgi:hypothetical protein